jgi:hypothetical protein
VCPQQLMFATSLHTLKQPLNTLKPTPDRPNSDQDPLSTATDTKALQPAQAQNTQNKIWRDTKRLTIYGSPCTKKAIAS